MEQTSPSAALAHLLDASQRPIYAVDADRQIVYCNAALATWLGLEPPRIVGRRVEYHSEAASASNRPRDTAAPLTDLCPPPQALAGDACSGTVGCVDRDGRLVHRRAEFVPLQSMAAADGNGAVDVGRCGVLVFLATDDMPSHEIAAEVAEEPSGDELHRIIRRFRRTQAAEYAVETLLGTSAAIQKVRTQVAAAASSHANSLLRGPRGSGRAQVGRAIHYETPDAGTLVPVDCASATEDSLRRAVEAIRSAATPKSVSTLLLLHLESLPPALHAQLATALAATMPNLRFVATMSHDVADVPPQIVVPLSTITIEIPPLADRLEDLPLVAQFFVEAANRGSAKQIGAMRPEALDLMALYRWPGELDELRAAVTAAHAACQSHEISPADLPAILHHSAKAAALPRRFVEKIVLEDLLADIEREVITRAMAQSGGNKSAAADLLGMTRPRLYRRLVQLGLVRETAEDESP